MTSTLIQMSLIMFCGAGWGLIKPAGLNAEHTRQVLTTVVYYVFLPALIVEVLLSTEISLQSIEFSVLGVGGILSTLLIVWILCRIFRFARAQTGAVLLAASFPNVTYLGLPVLEQTFGRWARSVAIQIDMFAAAPLVLTIGIAIARYYGTDQGNHKPLFSFLYTPPFLAAVFAILLNLNHIATPAWFLGTLKQLSAAVVPLMLFSLGLALNWGVISIKKLHYIILIILIKLLLMPLLVIQILPYLTLNDDVKAAAMIDMAMPSMVLGIVFCDRYKLDSSLYAMAVTVTTLLSIVSLPYWYSQL